MKIKKVVSIMLIGLLTIALLFLVTIYSIWANEISTVMSVKKLRERNNAHMDGSVYEMHVKGNFYFDEFLNWLFILHSKSRKWRHFICKKL